MWSCWRPTPRPRVLEESEGTKEGSPRLFHSMGLLMLRSSAHILQRIRCQWRCQSNLAKWPSLPRPAVPRPQTQLTPPQAIEPCFSALRIWFAGVIGTPKTSFVASGLSPLEAFRGPPSTWTQRCPSIMSSSLEILITASIKASSLSS